MIRNFKLLYFIILLSCCNFIEINCWAQPENNLPFAQMKGVKKIIVLYYPLEESKAYGFEKSASDTDNVYLLNMKGMMAVEYGYSHGVKSVKHINEYENGNLIKRSRYESGEGPFQTFSEANVMETSRYEWIYKDGKAINQRYYCCKDSLGLTEFQRYTYDSKGRLVTEVTNYYTFPKGIYLSGKTYDSLVERYDGDTILAGIWYSKDKAPDSFKVYKKYNSDGKLLVSYEQSPDKKHFNGLINEYSKSGKILHQKYTRDYPPFVQDDGIVLAADEINYFYDNEDKLIEVIYSALGKPRWKKKYLYFKN